MTCGNYRKKTEYRCPICGCDLYYNYETKRYECEKGHSSVSSQNPLSFSRAFVIDVTPIFNLNARRKKEYDVNTFTVARD